MLLNLFQRPIRSIVRNKRAFSDCTNYDIENKKWTTSKFRKVEHKHKCKYVVFEKNDNIWFIP